MTPQPQQAGSRIAVTGPAPGDSGSEDIVGPRTSTEGAGGESEPMRVSRQAFTRAVAEQRRYVRAALTRRHLGGHVDDTMATIGSEVWCSLNRYGVAHRDHGVTLGAWTRGVAKNVVAGVIRRELPVDATGRRQPIISLDACDENQASSMTRHGIAHPEVVTADRRSDDAAGAEAAQLLVAAIRNQMCTTAAGATRWSTLWRMVSLTSGTSAVRLTTAQVRDLRVALRQVTRGAAAS